MWGEKIVRHGQFVAGSMWVHTLVINVILLIACRPSCESSYSLTVWDHSFIVSVSHHCPPIPLYNPLLAQCQPCPTWPPAFPQMLTLLTWNTTYDSKSSESHVHFQMRTWSKNPCQVWQPVLRFTQCFFFIGGKFHPVLNPQPGREPSAAVSTAYSISLKLSSIYRSHFLCHTMVSGTACTRITLILFPYCLPSLNMLTHSMLCTCAYETAWSLKIWSTHIRPHHSRERNLHKFGRLP